MNTTTEGTVAGWKQAYTDVTNGLYSTQGRLEHLARLNAELEKKVEKLKLENKKLKKLMKKKDESYKRECAWTHGRIEEFVNKKKSDEHEEMEMLRALMNDDDE